MRIFCVTIKAFKVNATKTMQLTFIKYIRFFRNIRHFLSDIVAIILQNIVSLLTTIS